MVIHDWMTRHGCSRYSVVDRTPNRLIKDIPEPVRQLSLFSLGTITIRDAGTDKPFF